jgi:hypothetical protein
MRERNFVAFLPPPAFFYCAKGLVGSNNVAVGSNKVSLSCAWPQHS